MKIFAEHDLNYWFLRAMILALRRTENLDLKKSGDASVNALAANFLEIATTVILDQIGVRNGACQVYGVQKGNLSYKKLEPAKSSIKKLLVNKSFGAEHVEKVIGAISNDAPEPNEVCNSDLPVEPEDQLEVHEAVVPAVSDEFGKARNLLAGRLAKVLSFKTEDAKSLVKEIYKAAHPARIALEAGCAKWNRSWVEKEYLVDFSVLIDSRMIIAMESEGKHVDSGFCNYAGLDSNSIYWDFFKLLNVDAEYKFFLVVENTDENKNFIRPGLKVMLDSYFSDETREKHGQIWIFVFHPERPHPDEGDLPGFDMYVPETKMDVRAGMKLAEIESFLKSDLGQEAPGVASAPARPAA